MKKLLAIFLAVVMVLTLTTVAFAADHTDTLEAVVDDAETEGTVENAATFEVKTTAEVSDGDNYADITYYVQIEWTLTGDPIDILNGTLYKWNPTTLKYEEVAETTVQAIGENSSVNVEIKFTNKSNAVVAYGIAYADNDVDKLTTSESKASGSSVGATGTLDTADKNGAATAAPGTGHAYTIDESKIDTAGTVQTLTYNGVVSVTALADDTEIANGNTLTLGTYTVTLSEPAAE